MRLPKLEGARSYELGSVVSIRATWRANQISQYRTVRWQIKEFINDNILYEVRYYCTHVFSLHLSRSLTISCIFSRSLPFSLTILYSSYNILVSFV